MTDEDRERLISGLTKEALDPHWPSCPRCGQDYLEGYVLSHPPGRSGGICGVRCTKCGFDSDGDYTAAGLPTGSLNR